MNHDTPRLVANDAGVMYLNSIHGVTLVDEWRALGRELLPLAALNSATLLGAELVGRAYGGGLLKLEPKEADLLPVPTPELVETHADELRTVVPHVADCLRGGNLIAAANIVDNVLLVRGLGISRRDLRALRSARQAMFERRETRSGK